MRGGRAAHAHGRTGPRRPHFLALPLPLLAVTLYIRVTCPARSAPLLPRRRRSRLARRGSATGAGAEGLPVRPSPLPAPGPGLPLAPLRCRRRRGRRRAEERAESREARGRVSGWFTSSPSPSHPRSRAPRPHFGGEVGAAASARGRRGGPLRPRARPAPAPIHSGPSSARASPRALIARAPRRARPLGPRPAPSAAASPGSAPRPRTPPRRAASRRRRGSCLRRRLPPVRAALRRVRRGDLSGPSLRSRCSVPGCGAVLVCPGARSVCCNYPNLVGKSDSWKWQLLFSFLNLMAILDCTELSTPLPQ